MVLDPETCYRALKSHDARFDGRFFIGVSSTGIYCRPICSVKIPKFENCTFYASAAAAESKGYRPCLRCRPELAPGNAGVDASHRLAQAAAALIEDGTQTEIGMDGIARRLRVTDRHLRRVFQREFGVTPVAFVQTQRLLLSKRLLTDTNLPVTEVAFAAGFGSLRRFEALFQKRYRMTPNLLRKVPKEAALPDALTFELGFRPPYHWPAMLQFLGARAVTGVEEIAGSSYRRIVYSGQNTGWLEVTPQRHRPTLRVTVAASLSRVLPAVLARVKHLFDLSCNPAEVAEALGELAFQEPGLRVPGAFDGFEIAVRAILGQQISVAGARTLAGRFAKAFGCAAESPFPELNRAFPQPASIAYRDVTELAALGILPSRARSIIELADAMEQRELKLAPGVDVPATLAKLKAIRGIGEWTAQYIAMRTLAWPDAFPHTDLVLMKVLNQKRPAEMLAAGEAWRPWRAYATMHLWFMHSRYAASVLKGKENTLYESAH